MGRSAGSGKTVQGPIPASRRRQAIGAAGAPDSCYATCSGEQVQVEPVSVGGTDIVVALVEGSEATLKRFYRQANQSSLALLQPTNTETEPILVALADLAIQWRVLALLRKYA